MTGRGYLPAAHKRKTQELNNTLTTEEKTMREVLVYLRELRLRLKSPPNEGGQNQSEARPGRELGWGVGSRLGNSPGKEKPYIQRYEWVYQDQTRGTGSTE